MIVWFNYWKCNNVSIIIKGLFIICVGLGIYIINVILELESFFVDCIIYFL